MRFSLKARIVYPVDRPPIENGFVTIGGERIVAVGTKSDDDEVTDLGAVALIPGLVNAHTHLEFNYLQRPLGKVGMPLVDWIRLVIAERSRGEYVPSDDAISGLLESQAFGVTTIGDITTSAPTPDADVINFHEVIAFSRARAESAMNAIVERLQSHLRSGTRANQGISPHAPYTVSPKLIKLLVSHARQYDLPMAMHLAESREELELIDNGTGPFRQLLEERSMWDPEAIPRGSRPLDYLQMLAGAPRALVIHGNYLDFHDLSFLGANRAHMSLVYCPRTHTYFGHEPYPLVAAAAARVRVALGTDSRASNPDLSLLAEMRHLTCIHSAFNPQAVLRMGTLSGAKALGRDRDVGSISEGKLANLVAVPIEDTTATPDEILSAILAADSVPSAIYLAGRPLNM